MKKLSENEIKVLLLNILIEFNSVCDLYNIKYSLTGGTLLGAIRHNGFIPWDDDIDIGLRRKDYDKLVEIGKEYNKTSKRYKFSFPEYEDGNSWSFGKLIDINTKVLSKEFKNLKLFIDIFPYDYIEGNTINEANKNYNKLRLIQHIALYSGDNRRIIVNFSFKGIADLLIYLIIQLVKFVMNDKYFFYKILKKTLLACEKSDYLMSGTLRLVRPVVWEEKKLREFTIHKFENISFPIYKDYDYHLRVLYNDYMVLPPENERSAHYEEAYLI